jgi:hypothetical protein
MMALSCDDNAMRSGPAICGDALVVGRAPPRLQMLLIGELDDHDPLMRPASFLDPCLVVSGQQPALEAFQHAREGSPVPLVRSPVGNGRAVGAGAVGVG